MSTIGLELVAKEAPAPVTIYDEFQQGNFMLTKTKVRDMIFKIFYV